MKHRYKLLTIKISNCENCTHYDDYRMCCLLSKAVLNWENIPEDCPLPDVKDE